MAENTKTRQIRVLKSRIEDAEHGTDLAKPRPAAVPMHKRQDVPKKLRKWP